LVAITLWCLDRMCGASIGDSGMKDRVFIHAYHGSNNLLYSILQFRNQITISQDITCMLACML